MFSIVSRFDVWAGNFRGNKYSHKHSTLKPNSKTFWDFSLDELAIYDIPTIVDYILSTTQQPSLTYVGFSQGTASCFAALALNVPLNTKIEQVIALAATTVPKGTFTILHLV
jgi:lysosomal acid lipase/cholesteryl ester hydrolase